MENLDAVERLMKSLLDSALQMEQVSIELSAVSRDLKALVVKLQKVRERLGGLPKD